MRLCPAVGGAPICPAFQYLNRNERCDSGPREPSGEHANVCDEDPGLCGFDGSLEVLCEPTASARPCEGPLHDPAAGQDLEALGFIRLLDDLHRELADLL